MLGDCSWLFGARSQIVSVSAARMELRVFVQQVALCVLREEQRWSTRALVHPLALQSAAVCSLPQKARQRSTKRPNDPPPLLTRRGGSKVTSTGLAASAILFVITKFGLERPP